MSRFLAAYQQYVGKTTDAPNVFGHAAGLACLSTIALGRRWLNRGTGIKPNVFLMLTADSSRDRKSTSVDIATAMIRDVEEERVGPKDFTAEGLIGTMRSRKSKKGKEVGRSKIMIPISEFGRYLASAKSYNAATAAMLCDLYDGENYERVRSGKRPLLIEKPRVSLLGAVAFGMLEKFADPTDWVTGFFARMIWIMPGDSRPPRYYAQPPKPTAERDLAKACLFDLRNELKNSVGHMGVDPAADAAYAVYAQSFIGTDDDPVLAAQRERLLNVVWKLAMLYQIDDHPKNPIGARAMDNAIWFAKHAWVSFQQIYGKTAGSQFAKLALKIQERATAAGPAGINRRELYRTMHLSAEHFDRAVDVLIKNGVIEVIQQGKTFLIRALGTP